MNEKTSASVEKIYIVEDFFRTECQSTKNQKYTDGKTALPFTLPNCQPDETGTFQKSIDDKLESITPSTGENMKSIKICLALALLLMSMFSAHAAGKVFFVAPNGLPTNNGSQSSPWDLQTALANRSKVVTAGDVIYLRGGVYKGSFTSSLVGAPGSPITVRSFPGEWAIIDANQNITLATGIGTEKGTITFSGDVKLSDPAVVMIDNEHIQIVNRVGNTFSINARGWTGTIPAPHAAGSPVRVVGEILTINGSDVVFGNFEVTDSKVERILAVSGSNPVHFNRRYTGINVFAPRSKIINTVVHDAGQGIGFWAQAVDSELYGNILYNNGEEAPDRGHGHGIYTQNALGRKTIGDNITFGNYGTMGMKVYGSSSSTLRGYDIVGNVNFLNQYLVGGNAPSDDIRLDSNFLYGEGFKLGYGNPNNGSVILTNNYSYSALPADVMFWQKLIMKGNRFYQSSPTTGAVAAITLPPGQNVLSQYQIDNNKYIFGRAFLGKPFCIKSTTVDYYGFAEWQKFGFDATSSYTAATQVLPTLVKPTGIDIFYRPNKYERGRANIIIYNYNQAATLTLDLSKTGLAPGQKFQIRNGQNFKAAPLISGTYSSSTMTLNVSNLKIAQPFGNTTIRNAEVAPEFVVLVVVPLP